MSHPFGDLLRQYRARKAGLSLALPKQGLREPGVEKRPGERPYSPSA